MPAGEGFTAAQRQQIDKAIRDAETLSRFAFSVYVGAPEGSSRVFAERLHATLAVPDRSVLILVDPARRVIEVVTGAAVRRELDDREVRLAILDMQSQFAHDDLAGGIVRGVQRLADHARRPPTLHS